MYKSNNITHFPNPQSPKRSNPVVTRVKARCFELVLQDAGLIPNGGGDFKRVYGIDANTPSCGIWRAIDLYH